MTGIEMSKELRETLAKPNKLEQELASAREKAKKIKEYDSKNNIGEVLAEVYEHINYSGGKLVYDHFTESDPPRCILITLGATGGVIASVRPPALSEGFDVGNVEGGVVGARFNYRDYDILIKPIGKEVKTS